LERLDIELTHDSDDGKCAGGPVKAKLISERYADCVHFSVPTMQGLRQRTTLFSLWLFVCG
jgi:hypothetical protein